MNNNFESKLNLYLRSEKALLTLLVREKSRQIVFIVLAIFALLSTLILLNVSAYYALLGYLTPQISTLVLAGANVIISIVMLLIANKKTNQVQAAGLVEVRDFAKSQVAEELLQSKNEIMAVIYSIKHVTDDVGEFFSGKLLWLESILPLISNFLSSKKSK
ncbi:MAG: hypothetical protein P1U74_01975 [Legionellaceae bacterium]|nr:hypothetical protein [Legionellaceae bacterium]